MDSFHVALSHQSYLPILLLNDLLHLSIAAGLLILHLLHHGIQSGRLPLLHLINLMVHFLLELRVGKRLLHYLRNDLWMSLLVLIVEEFLTLIVNSRCP